MPGLGFNCVLCLNFVLFCLSTAAALLLSEGDTCTATGGVEGVCAEVTNCPEVVSQIEKRVFPVRCNLNRLTLFCCPKSTNTTTTTNTNPPSTTNQTTTTETQISKSEKMCLKYARYVFVEMEDPTLLSTDAPRMLNVSTCGMATETLIVGGTKASPREFPHMVALGYGDRNDIAWQCGGSLISERFVLTTALCLVSRGIGTVRWARMGDLNLHSPHDDENAVTMEVEEAIKHEDYKPPAYYNDIGLLKLKNEVTFTPHIRPACLYSEPGNPPDSKVTALGWGKVDISAESGSENLMKVDLNLLPPNYCNHTYRTLVGTPKLRNGVTVDSMICAGDLVESKDTCGGDSGGPLQIRLDRPYCMCGIIGLTSFGSPACGHNDKPAVYTRVPNYLTWIERHVWP